MGGHTGENDFELAVDINGETVRLTSKNGIFSEDIRLCSADPQISLSIKAFERDKWFDDEYMADGGGQITLNAQSGAIKEVNFTRKSYTGGIFTPKKSAVRIQVLK